MLERGELVYRIPYAFRIRNPTGVSFCVHFVVVVPITVEGVAREGLYLRYAEKKLYSCVNRPARSFLGGSRAVCG